MKKIVEKIKMGLITVEDVRAYTILEMLYKLIDRVNDVIRTSWIHSDKIEELEENKLSIDDFEDNMTNVRKLDSNANFTGSWFGITNPVYSEPGIAGVVKKNTEDIEKLNKDINKIKGVPDILNLNRLGRKFYPEKVDSYCNSQSSSWIDEDTIIQAYQIFNGNTVRLVKMNVRTGEELQSNIIDGYHANGMCYNQDDGYIYLTPAHNSDQSTHYKLVQKVDKNFLTVTSTIDLTPQTGLHYVASIGYDSKSKQYVVNCDNHFEVYNQSWKLVDSFSIASNYNSMRYQTITVNDGIIYQFTSAPESCMMIELESKELLKTINIDKWQNKFFNLGEIEGVSFIPNTRKGYITSQSRFTTTIGGSLTQFWAFDFEHNESSSNNLFPFQSADGKTTVFVKADNLAYNPVGTSGNPFPTIAEACTTLSSPYASNKTLNLLSSFDETVMLSESLSNLVVNGGDLYSIKALIMENCTNVYIPVLTLSGTSTYHNNSLYLYMSELTTTNINYTKTDDEYYSFIERSKLKCPTGFMNATGIKHFIKNSEVSVESTNTRLKFSGVIKENGNSKFKGLKWANGGVLASSVTLPSDWKYYDKACVIFRIDGKSEIMEPVSINNDGYTIRLSVNYQNDGGDFFMYSAYLKPVNGVYQVGTSTGCQYVGGTMSKIDNPPVIFDIVFYD